MNQGGLKHAATESRLDNKRERRRGASGRAAALRRAPSDSDCSGETASLSADSGDRAVRLPPPTTRAAKSRSRRRGSEWEVLEGLKDGQRFEKRPDVFNGYLHKKRKWPLKGWHKRFFVVDGGILVYARSPTDVARGRLHGSVDVGLSVISAKARRRRIDIDADEFIYHLRAKTPDVFRTWLNVLKAHRLYRQHLLTFGARESVPKIHAPLDDLPPTDNSSRTSRVSVETALTSSEDFRNTSSSVQSPKIPYDMSNDPTKTPIACRIHNKERKFFNFQKKYNAVEKINETFQYTNRSLCSMNCFIKGKEVKECNVSHDSTNAEQQMLITDLESSSLNPSPMTKSSNLENFKERESPFMIREKKPELAAYYFFSRKKHAPAVLPKSPMRKSKKSTNLVKYKNVMVEPRLKDPLSKCLLLKKHRSRSPKNTTKLSNRGVLCDVIPKQNNQVQANDMKEHKSLQDLMTVSEYDRITEHLMLSLFENHISTHNAEKKEVKYYINQVVKELYDVKFSQTHVHPVKVLFRALLEYWLKNTSGEQFKDALTRVKSVHKASNAHFTQDQILSSFLISNATKQTQFHGISNYTNDYEVSDHLPKCYQQNQPKPKPEKKAIRCHSPKRDTESFEKERRIQELERILKNTVYICETVCSNHSKEKDIRITKRLIDNLGKISKKSGLNNVNGDNGADNSNSSSEIPKIQETINHLISETSVSPDVAKEFLNAYLDILINESSKSLTRSSSQSSEPAKGMLSPACDVQAESIQRKASKNITTASFGDNPIRISYTDGDQPAKPPKSSPDPGELYLKEVLDKITTVFSKVNTFKTDNIDQSTGDKKNQPKKEFNSSEKEYPGKKLIQQNCDENTVVIDLSKFDLEHISMFSDPTLKGIMSITIKLKEKPPNCGEIQSKQLSLKFCQESMPSGRLRSDDWLHNLDSSSLRKIFDPGDVNRSLRFDCDPNFPKDPSTLKPYSSSDKTPTFYQIVHESEHSLDLSFKSSNFFKKEYADESDETHSCYIVSSLKKNAITKSQTTKKKVIIKHNNGLVLGPQIRSPNQCSTSRYPDEYTVFEQPTPKIIDEKFILLLMENLTLLSKNLPSLYKDINTLFMKLKKKHEKIVRNCSNIHGLSLLGKIYNDDFKPNDRSTQYELESIYGFNVTPNVDVAVSTFDLLLADKSVTDKSLSTCGMAALSKITEVQTEQTSEITMRVSVSNETMVIDALSKNAISTRSLPKEQLKVERAASAVMINSLQKVATKSCGVSTTITCPINQAEEVKNFYIARSKHFENVFKIEKGFPLTQLSKEKDTISIKKEFTKGLTPLTPSFKSSTESQTDEIYLHKSKDVNTVNEFNPHNEFNVYQLCLSVKEPNKSNSLIDMLCLTKEKSDDLKTIYRCKSEPSYCSGLNHTFIAY